MTPLSVNDLSHNAYRVLGLTAAATQTDIDAAARRLRLWDNPVDIPPTTNDAAWMGPVPRTKRDIETAVARLADPECRIEERLWWFCTTPPATDDPAAAGHDATAQHDGALVQLHRALITQTGKSLTAWRDLIRRFETLADSGDYLTWLLGVEADGDFEKRASPEEVSSAQGGITARLHSALAENVETALDDENFSAAREAIQLMQKSTTTTASVSASTVIANPAEKSLGRLEDLLIQRCEALRDQVHQAWNTRKIAILKPACRRCLMAIPKQLLPLIEELRILCPNDADRVQRAQIHGANVLMYTADALEGCYDFLAAERAILQARDLVQGTAMESSLQRRLEATALNARRQRLGAGPTFPAKPGAGVAVSVNRPFKVIGTGNSNYGGTWVSAFPKRAVGFLVVVVFIAIGHLVSSRSPTTTVQETFPRIQEPPPAPRPQVVLPDPQRPRASVPAPHVGL